MGHYCDDEGIFVATNATNFPQGSIIGTLSVSLSDSAECTTDAHDNALTLKLDEPVTFEINDFGMIEDTEGGWFTQAIRELEGNSTLPVSLAELVAGESESEYGLAVYLLSSDDELLGCASLKKHDEETAAEYYELLNGVSQEAVKVKEAPSSGSKIGQFVYVSAIAAVGIAFVLGDVFAL